jgi:hypothetical protein
VSELHDKQVHFARLLPRLIDHAYGLGLEVALGEAHRTPEQAALNAQKGIGIKNSLHCDRLAIDLLLFRGGVYLRDSDDYRELGEFWESLSTPGYQCCWGGYFKDDFGYPKPDGGHFSIAHNGRK